MSMSESTIETKIEIVRLPDRVPPPRLAIFDFDGTLSLIREGWQEVMVSMMLEYVEQQETTTSLELWQEIISAFVVELTGKPTILQMVRLAEEIKQRGGSPADPEVYGDEFQKRLDNRCDSRRNALIDESDHPSKHLVPDVLAMLEDLAERQIKMAVVSGTDEASVLREIKLLRIDHHFEGRIHAAPGGAASFSKRDVIANLTRDMNVAPEEVVGFGDGVVETAAMIDNGGLAIGIAGDEAVRLGKIDQWKRDRLVDSGAHVVMADFRPYQRINQWLFDGTPLVTE